MGLGVRVEFFFKRPFFGLAESKSGFRGSGFWGQGLRRVQDPPLTLILQTPGPKPFGRCRRPWFFGDKFWGLGFRFCTVISNDRKGILLLVLQTTFLPQTINP